MRNKDLKDKLDDHIGGLWFRVIMYRNANIGEHLKRSLLGLRLNYLRQLSGDLGEKYKTW